MSITIYHVTAPAVRRDGQPFLFSLPVEAASKAEALSKADRVAKRFRIRFVFVPQAHRCAVAERALDGWVRDVFEFVRAECKRNKKERGTE